MIKEQIFNQTQADNFASSLLDMLNKSSLALMISIGHRSGLFDALSDMDFATSAEISEKTKLNERYVREWLGAMVSGGVMEYLPEEKLYKLPAEHAAYLTRKVVADNMAVFMQYVSIMGEVERSEERRLGKE